ncbi:hypothetical protein Poli38472_010467 [Pythium oligandrum]|uniref:TIR domain-containing protein n=1 Tax=Pythium oligandrum TaxID=41045 RepID=A0A8K1C343_PYTOL|nr:hypothetical protein Poli38472_010467 [Pythium oligandrum]|eukprot:TMW55585.1 hypothetical protein Poli38472_010467 [Pythium oligandrum]
MEASRADYRAMQSPPKGGRRSVGHENELDDRFAKCGTADSVTVTEIALEVDDELETDNDTITPLSAMKGPSKHKHGGEELLENGDDERRTSETLHLSTHDATATLRPHLNLRSQRASNHHRQSIESVILPLPPQQQIPASVGSSNPAHMLGAFKFNSYFAIRLLHMAQIIVVIDAVALLFFYGFRRGHSVVNGGSVYVKYPLKVVFEPSDSCATTSALAALVYHLVPAVIILALPASGLHVFEPFKREHRIGRGGHIQKVKRTIFLQFCEMTAVFMFFYISMVIALGLYYIVVTDLFDCPRNPAVYVFGFGALVVLWLMYMEIRYFTRFREHLKMQLGAFSEADQTGDVKAHMARSKMRRRLDRGNPSQVDGNGKNESDPSASNSKAPPRKQIVHFVRKRLFRGAQLGDIPLLRRTLRIARRHLGEDFARELYPDATIVCWFFSFSKKNPMHVAAYHGNIAAMELLYRAKLSVNAFDKTSRVRFSTGDMFWYLARFFIRQPVVSAEDAYGSSSIFKSTLVTPLHCAVSTGRLEAVRWLLQRGADVNLCSKSSYRSESKLPPIFVVDHPEITKELLAAGANHLVIPDPGHMNTITVLQLAYLRGNYAVAQVLENWGGDIALTPLHTAAAMNDTTKLRNFLRKKVHPDCLGELGYVGLNKRTPLHWATVNGAKDAVELLLDAKADANFQDARGRTPLHWAARVNRLEVVKILLDNGADPNIADDGGMTPILCAACAGGTSAEMFKALVNHGANINYQLPSTGDTALHIAVKLDDQQTAVALLSVGGDIMRMNHDGFRPIDCTTSTRLQFEIKRAAGNRDVMISYTHSHMEFALKLRKSLEDANITTWLDLMDPSGIGGGAVWREEIARGVTNAAVVMCILTEDYAQSPWCMKELALAKQVGTPILAISTENAKISEELQVYLYTRQIIPFEAAITSVDHVDVKNIQYSYDDGAYNKQLRLLLDGLRDEIEKRKEEVVRKNLHRAVSSLNGSSMASIAQASSGGGSQRRQLDQSGVQGGRTMLNPTAPFDERAAAALAQERDLMSSRDGTFLKTQRGQGWNPGMSGIRQGREGNGTTLSMTSTMIDDYGLGLNNLSNSIILSQSGYYVHKPPRAHGELGISNKIPAIGNGSLLETFQEVKEKTAGGQRFVFISHGDAHETFVMRLCASLCREGGLHCFVDRRRRLKSQLSSSSSRVDENGIQSSPQPNSGQDGSQFNSSNGQDSPSGSNDDWLSRIHEAKEAILKCSAFVVIISEHTLRNQLVKDQLAFAEDKGKTIIPIVVNRMEFSLDMQYTLARSDFFHFFTSGNMVGFERSLEGVLTALREEVYGSTVEPEETNTKTLSYDEHLATSFHGIDEANASFGIRRRGGSTHSASSSHSSWLEQTMSNRSNLSFVGVSSSARSYNDMSFHHSMHSNFSSLMRGIPDELEDELEADLDERLTSTVDEELQEPDDLDDAALGLQTNGSSFYEKYRVNSQRSSLFSSVVSNSSISVSMLELHSSEEDAKSVDGYGQSVDV